MYSSKRAFTLIETLIVVMIMVTLAAIVVPQFTNASGESKLSNLKSNLQSIRAQLELYKMHHNETYPTNLVAQMTQKTNTDGTINPAGIHGPYLIMFPANPFVDDTVEAVKTDGNAGEGWDYDSGTGIIIPNTAGHAGL